jgi:putative hydrolase of the HAD superfamily
MNDNTTRNGRVTAPRITAVLFDLDDTLIDWSGQSVPWQLFIQGKMDNLYDFFAGEGHTLPERPLFYDMMNAQITAVWDKAKQDYSAPYFGDALRGGLIALNLDPQQFDLPHLMRIFDWTAVPGVVPYDDAHDTLNELKRRGYKIGLLTNSFFPMWMRDVELRHYNLLDYFDARITAGDTDYMKPHPAIYRCLLDKLDVPPEQAVFVGDWPEFDLAGANKVGMISVLLTPPHLNRELAGVQPDYTIARLGDLLPILNSLENDV